MFRYALTLLSTFRIGVALKNAAARRIRAAIVFAIAGVLLYTAAMFGLVAGYSALMAEGFTGVEAAGTVAGGLVVLAAIVLAALPIMNRRVRPAPSEIMAKDGAAGAVGFVDDQLGQVVKQVGPIGVLATAFAIGVLASRRAGRS